jgi:hypothetical protein
VIIWIVALSITAVVVACTIWLALPGLKASGPAFRGSYDDITDDLENNPPIACDACGERAAHPQIGGFIFKDLRTCPSCKRIGCRHWCDGVNPCDWCTDGEPEGDIDES